MKFILLLFIWTGSFLSNDKLSDDKQTSQISAYAVLVTFSPTANTSYDDYEFYKKIMLINMFDVTFYENIQKQGVGKSVAELTSLKLERGTKFRITPGEYLENWSTNALVNTDDVKRGPLKKVLKYPFLG